ncbi:MAG: hypothetical protein GX337_07425, partial [Christensenellaceae bacterium]|nr:hypothetical protein [Christensenellaceae bacterium]
MYNHLRKKIALVMALLMFFSNVPFVALAGSFTGLTQDVSKNEGSVSKILAANPVEDTHTYTFMVDGEQLGDKQIVKNGQHLVEPQAPEKPNYKFKGWYVGDEKVKFGESNPIAVTSTEEFTANARFEEVYYVFFMDGTGSDPRVFTTKDGTAGDSVSTDVTLPIGSTQAVTGWYKDKDLTDGPVSDPYIIGTSNQTLWPKIEEGHYLYFVSGENGTYIEPQFVLPTGTTTKPDPNPTRPGYTFSHWSTTQGGPAYSFGQPITADVTLYAVWTPKTDTSYTVVFWKQSVNDSQNADDDAKTYDYAESVVRTAETGATVSPTTPDRNKNYNGFKYNSAKSISVTVKGDGTTILNVYYDRNKLTIDFHRNGEYGAEDGEYTGLYGQTLAQNGYTWPSSHRWTRYDWGGTTLTFLDAFIFDGLWGNGISIDLYAQSHSGTRDIVHYKEALDGTWVEAISLKGSGTFTFTNKYTGFTVSQYRTKRSNGTWTDWQSATGSASVNYGMEIRHARNSYDLAFYNYNTTVRKETLKFEASLTEFASYQPPRPAGLPEEYIFQGWYKDEAYSESFNFATETMPSNDLMIYAEWAPPEVTATIHLALAGGGTVTKTLTYNQSIDPATMPTVKDHNGNVLSQGDDSNIVTVPENHKWIGWTTKVGASYISYNFSTLVLSDIELYPYYVNNAPFTVTYNAGGGTGTPPEDSNQYAVGAYADVKSALGLTAPTDKVFLGWENGGTIYQPGDKIQITGNMTLTAQWGTVKDKTQVTYKPGIGAIGSDHVVDEMLINQSFTLKNVGECGFTAKPNYEFKGWLNATDNKVYQPGVQLQVDDENQGTQNILTAQWAPILTVTSGDKSWSYDGNSHTYKQYTLVYGDQTIIGDEGQTSFTMNDDKTVTITPTGKGASGVKTVSDNSDNNNTFTVSTTAEQGTHVFGTLSITAVTDKVTVTITENSGTELYDGSEKTVTGYTVTSISNPLYTVDDFTFSGTASVSGTNAGTYDMELEPGDFTNNSANFTNVTFVIVDGTLTINPKAVTISTGGGEKEYDGSALTNATVGIEGLVDGESVTLTATGSQTEVGISDNTYDIEWDNAKESNYTVTDNLGELKVTTSAAEVILTAPSDSKIYDGTALTKTTGVTWTGLPADFTVEATASGSQTDAGSSANVVNDGYVIKDAGGNNKTANFTDITKVPGTLKVTPKPVTISTGGGEKEYDGIALTNAIVGIEGLVDGESVTLAASGSQTEVGSSANTYSITWDNAKAANY